PAALRAPLLARRRMRLHSRRDALGEARGRRSDLPGGHLLINEPELGCERLALGALFEVRGYAPGALHREFAVQVSHQLFVFDRMSGTVHFIFLTSGPAAARAGP